MASGSDSSSDDEEVAKLREAADFEFISDDLFNTKHENSQPREQPPSLRLVKNENEQFNSFSITQEFRNHVARHLERLLTKSLSYLDKSSNNQIKSKRRKSGIKLFKNSPHFVSLQSRKDQQLIRRIKVVDSEDECLDRFRFVAVSAADIITQKDTLHWSTRSKAPVFTYLNTKQGLVLKE